MSFASSKPKLLDEVRAVARMRHLSLRTEQAYMNWIRRFILFHKKRHPAEMNEPEIRAFISDLAVNGNISASTQTVALSALLFLYRDVLKKQLPYVSDIERAPSRKKLPVVFTRDEVKRVLAELTGTRSIIVRLPYGSGLRLMECLRLRVKDLDFTYGQLMVRDGKGARENVHFDPAIGVREEKPLARRRVCAHVPGVTFSEPRIRQRFHVKDAHARIFISDAVQNFSRAIR